MGKLIVLNTEEFILNNGYNLNLIQALKDTGNTSIVLFSSKSITAENMLKTLKLIRELHKNNIEIANLLLPEDSKFAKDIKKYDNTTLFSNALKSQDLRKKYFKKPPLNNDLCYQSDSNTSPIKNIFNRIRQIYTNIEFLLITHSKQEIDFMNDIQNIKNYSDEDRELEDLGYEYYAEELISKKYITKYITKNFTIDIKNLLISNWLDNKQMTTRSNEIIICSLFILLGFFLTFCNLPIFSLFATNKILTLAGCFFLGILSANINYKYSFNKLLANKIATNLLAKHITQSQETNEYYAQLALLITLSIIFFGLYLNFNYLTILISSIFGLIISANVLYKFNDIKRKSSDKDTSNYELNNSNIAKLILIIATLSLISWALLAYMPQISTANLLFYLIISTVILSYNLFNPMDNRDLNISIETYEPPKTQSSLTSILQPAYSKIDAIEESSDIDSIISQLNLNHA